MKKLLTILACAVACANHAQHINNPYQDQTNQPFALAPWLPTAIGQTYLGEYQIFLNNFHWDASLFDLSYKIEVVSFPFTPPTVIPPLGSRPMYMPDLESYGYNDGADECEG